MKFLKETNFWIGVVVGVAIYYGYTYWEAQKDEPKTE